MLGAASSLKIGNKFFGAIVVCIDKHQKGLTPAKLPREGFNCTFQLSLTDQLRPGNSSDLEFDRRIKLMFIGDSPNQGWSSFHFTLPFNDEAKTHYLH